MAEQTKTYNAQQHPFNSLRHFTMFAKVPGSEESTQRARLTWVTRDGYPRITVYTNVTGDKSNGVIYGAMNPETFFVLIKLLEEIATGDPNQKKGVECHTRFKDEDGKPGEIRHVSNIIVGKDAEGIVWISVVSTDDTRPKIKFEFQISEFHRILENGQPFTAAKASMYQALAVVNAMRNIYSRICGEFAPAYTGNNAKPRSGYTIPAVANTPMEEDITF